MAATETLVEEKIPTKSAVSVSMADASVALLQGLIGAGLAIYFTDVRGLSVELNFLAWMIFLVWNSVNDPLIGYIADKTKHELGRRIPYIRYGVPILVVGYILCWAPIPGLEGNQLGLFIQLILALFIYDTMYTAVATALYIMPYEMAVSNRERTRVFVWKTLFSVIAIAVPIIILPIIQPGPTDPVMPYFTFHLLLALFVGFIVFVSTYFYTENKYTQHEEQTPFVEALKLTFKNRSFIAFEFISFTSIYLVTALPMGLIYYVQLVLDSMDEFFLQIIGLIAGVVIGFWFFITKNETVGTKKSMLLLIGPFAIGCMIILLFGLNVILTMIGMIFVGVGFAGSFIMIPLMNGDVIDYDESVTGLRREGMYAGVNSFVTKPGISIAEGVVPLILASFGYVSGAETQPATVEIGVLIAWMVIPVVLLTISFLVIWKFYKLEGPEWREKKARLAEIHVKKERELLASLGYAYTDEPEEEE
ncbi:MAG: MFS transporter [Candidatus Lokiarchaeota archaeon]|nr:MFS transporter [Candidatus Lokiarchaeota archaeon]